MGGKFENYEYEGYKDKKGEFDGYGKISWIRGEMTGTIYEGNFKNGKFHGKGILEDKWGNRYEG
jgi:hypothetical protein